MKSQRKLRNYLSAARLGRTPYLYVFSFSVVFLGGAVIYITRMIRSLVEQLSMLPGAESGQFTSVYASLNEILLVFFSTFLVYIFLAISFIVFIEQRVGGPTVSILRYIEDIEKGDYQQVRELRQGDELQSIMAALKRLAQSLRDRANG